MDADAACPVICHADAAFHNAIANDPAVRPTLGYHEGATDFTPLLAEPDHYLLLSDGEGVAGVLEWTAPGVWQGHTMVKPESRGRKAVRGGRAICRYMFEKKRARMLWGMTPERHREAQMFNRMLGFKPEGTITDAAGVECRLFVMEAR